MNFANLAPVKRPLDFIIAVGLLCKVQHLNLANFLNTYVSSPEYKHIFWQLLLPFCNISNSCHLQDEQTVYKQTPCMFIKYCLWGLQYLSSWRMCHYL